MTRVLGFAAALMLLGSPAALAQSGLRSASLPDRTPMDPIPAPRADLFVVRPDTYAPRYDRLPDRHPDWPHLPLGFGYLVEPDRERDSREPRVYIVALPPPAAAPAPAQNSPPVPVVPGVPKTFYVVPGCYAGDTPPRAESLPRGCDPSRMRKIPPVVR